MKSVQCNAVGRSDDYDYPGIVHPRRDRLMIYGTGIDGGSLAYSKATQQRVDSLVFNRV